MTKTLCSAIHVRKSLAGVWGEGLCACTTASPRPLCLQTGKFLNYSTCCFQTPRKGSREKAGWGGYRHEGGDSEPLLVPSSNSRQSPRRLNRKGSELRIAS